MVQEGERTRSALLIALDKDVDEIEELATTAGYDILYEVVQLRARAEPKTFVGRGKLHSLIALIQERPVDVVILKGEAKPSQFYNIESELGVMCVDRVGLILDIFASRVNSKESKLQVEKARLRYEIPLLKEWIHTAKSGEHPGFMGGGEYAVDVYYDLVKRRMKAIDDELRNIKRDTDQRRLQRAKRGFVLVSLTGYTNAGKSSLMRAITSEDVLIENRMFSTLSTTTRKLSVTEDRILLTDTIGFLKDLPHFMIESFRNTIEEIFDSDLVLLVLDSSDDIEVIEERLTASSEILFPRVDMNDVIIIMNKIDLYSNKNRYTDIEETIRISIGPVEILKASAKTGEGIEIIVTTIQNRFSKRTPIRIYLPNKPISQSAMSTIYDLCEISDENRNKDIVLSAKCHPEDIGRLRRSVMKSSGRLEVLGAGEGNNFPPET